MKVFSLICFLIGFYFLPVMAEGIQDDAKADLENIKKVLDALQKKQETEIQEGMDSFEKDLAGGLASEEEAVKLFLNCAKKVDFSGKKLDSKEWNEWKGRNAGMLDDKYFKKWIHCQLRYFELWTKAYKKVEIKQLDESLVALIFDIHNSVLLSEKEYVDKKLSNDQVNEERRHRNESIGTGISGTYFSKAYHLQGLFKETKGWELTLSSPESILENLLMNEYRAANNPRLFDLWEKRLELEELRIKYLSLSSEQKFNHENSIFSFQWKIAQDYKTFGLQNKAINLMFTIISKAPDHPQFEAWTKELRGAITAGKP